MTAAALIAVALSGALLVLLGARDPKRLRNARPGSNAAISPLPPVVRHACSWLLLAPGIALGMLGEWWAFLIWLGAISGIGWAIAITAGYSAGSVSPRTPS